MAREGVCGQRRLDLPAPKIVLRSGHKNAPRYQPQPNLRVGVPVADSSPWANGQCAILRRTFMLLYSTGDAALQIHVNRQ
jgi:hypothetical protein